ncbi:cytochrome o ubiquinol oxidase subunit IV [Candidatus Saccharibacteria bacterium]|nr:cytochrome o ubiquinol oxidase subunit IV [Candidatus Saccharibacteria bacterium]
MSNPKNNSHYGSMSSYIIGFVLSLIFTVIPYYVVVNQILQGTTLLVLILIIAVIQMIIQIVFFLHLGRGPKPNWNLYFFASTVGIILVVVAGSLMIMSQLYLNMSPSDQIKRLVNNEGIYQIGGELTGACRGQYANHVVEIKDGYVSPYYSYAQKCDTLTFTNEDRQERKIMFGSYPDGGVYAGETEILLRSGRSKTITLSETGIFQFHDETDKKVSGQFSVSQ